MGASTAERCKNTSAGAMLEDGYASRTTMDGFLQVKNCAAEPTAVAEGDACMWASIAV